jgi:hypothetical protein
MPAAEQLPLAFERPRTTPEQIVALVEFLRGRGWMTAQQISTSTGWTDRHVRDLASTSDDIISYPGSPGYKLLKDCTLEEYDRYRLARRSQARDMIAKVVRTDRIFYRRPAIAP